MPERVRGERSAALVVAAMLVAIVLVAWIHAAYSTPGQQIVQTEESSPRQQTANNDPPIVARSFDPTEDSYAQWLMAFTGFAATGVSVWAVIVLLRTLAATESANRNTAVAVSEAAETNRITREAYINDQRPWLSLGQPVVRHIEIQGGRFRLGTQINVKNVGKSPATNIRLWVAFHRLGINVRGYHDLEQFCAECRADDHDPAGRNKLLFPGYDDNLKNSTDRDITASEIPRVVGIRFLICVTYRSIVSDSVHHVGVAGTAIVKPARTIGREDEVITEGLEVITRNDYASMS